MSGPLVISKMLTRVLHGRYLAESDHEKLFCGLLASLHQAPAVLRAHRQRSLVSHEGQGPGACLLCFVCRPSVVHRNYCCSYLPPKPKRMASQTQRPPSGLAVPHQSCPVTCRGLPKLLHSPSRRLSALVQMPGDPDADWTGIRLPAMVLRLGAS